MISDSPIRWNEPATWPWIFYVWAAFVLAGLVRPAREWLLRQRAVGWPVTHGRVDSVEISKPNPLFATRRGYWLAELRYSYTVAGTLQSGRYKRYLPTDHEAEEFVRDLQGKPVTVHCSSTNPAHSALLEADIEVLLKNRGPAPDSSRPTNSLPQWTKPFLWIFIVSSCTGLVISLWVHLGAVSGRRVAPEACFWILHIGIFVVWFPAMFAAKQFAGNMNRRDLWKVVLKGSPAWMRYMVYGFFAYAMGNFLFFMIKAPIGKTEGGQPVAVWRGFSGHWMAFYSAALAILYAAVCRGNTSDYRDTE